MVVFTGVVRVAGVARVVGGCGGDCCVAFVMVVGVRVVLVVHAG